MTTAIRVPVSPRTNMTFGWGRGRCEVVLHHAGKGGHRSCGSTGNRVCSNPDCRAIACGLHGEKCRCGGTFVQAYISEVAFAECAACPTLVAYSTKTGATLDAGSSSSLGVAFCAKCTRASGGETKSVTRGEAARLRNLSAHGLYVENFNRASAHRPEIEPCWTCDGFAERVFDDVDGDGSPAYNYVNGSSCPDGEPLCADCTAKERSAA